MENKKSIKYRLLPNKSVAVVSSTLFKTAFLSVNVCRIAEIIYKNKIQDKNLNIMKFTKYHEKFLYI